MTDLPLIAIVPARGGSKGLPGKNTRPLLGKALFRHAIDQGLAAGAGLCILTTDIPDLLQSDQGPKVRVLPRPQDLAGDDTPMDPVLMHALADHDGPARVVLLQPTSPLRSVDDITAAITLHKGGAYDLVMSVSQTPSHILKYGLVEDGHFRPVSDPAFCFMNRQALPPVYRPNGAVYVFDKDWFLRNGRLATGRIGAVTMPEERAADVDTEADFIAAETTLRGVG